MHVQRIGEDFQSKFRLGEDRENRIANFMISRGWDVLPVYEKEGGDFKGPRFFTAEWKELIAPDMLVFKSGKILWIEAKHKTRFSWSRYYECWETGIDIHHWESYERLQARLNIDVWIMFLHTNSVPLREDLPYCPGGSPIGLFGNSVAMLQKKISHKCPPKRTRMNGNSGHGRSGMIYWDHKKLLLIATLQQMSLR